MTACASCGTTYESGRFCPRCGQAFGDTSSSAVPDPLLGAVVDGLRFEAVLGRGTSGHVYRVTQLALERPLAVKVPAVALAGDATAMRRFRREALALARIAHPGVVTVHLVGDLPDGRPYLALELLAGQSLEAALAADPVQPAPRAPTRALDLPRAVDLALQIAEALAEVHAREVVHRDLKPDNVMLVRPQIGGDRAVLVDFGIALPVASADATRLTAGGGLVGTPHYMAPEQVQGDDLDGRADIYALGATLYRMLTGRVPFDGSGVEVVVAHLARQVRPVRELAPEVPAALEAIVMRCLAKRADDRWPGAAELARALATLDLAAGDPLRAPRARRVSDVPVDPVAAIALGPGPTQAAATRRRSYLAGGALFGVALGAGVALAVTHHPARPAPDAGVPGRGIDAAPAPPPPDAPPVAEPDPAASRALIVADGGLSMRVVVPAQIVVAQPVRFALEIWDADGAAVAADQVVVTIEGADEPRGFAATRAGMGRSVFAFTTTFARPGRYRLRVFPPVGDATFVVDIDVGPV